jgi:integrase
MAKSHVRGLTPIAIANLKPRAGRYEVPDRKCSGLYLAVSPSGRKGFVFRYRRPRVGKAAKLTIGEWFEGPKGAKQPEPVLGNPVSLAAARELAAKAQRRLKERIDPGEEALEAKRVSQDAEGNTLRRVAEQYLALEAPKLRTGDQRRDTFQRLIYPVLGGDPIADIRRGDIMKLLDKVEAGSGPRMADEVLVALSRLFNWYAVRDETFRSPLVRGMRRAAPAHERARTRILSDDELSAVWGAALAMAAPSGAFIRFLLLSTARRSEAAGMRWSELEGQDWLLPKARNKVKQDLIRPLAPAALAVVSSLPRTGDLVFAGMPSFARLKVDIDERSGVRDWVLHDLRRTGRSLLSRAGINADHAERCLGHVIGGIRGTYDRHEFYLEKKHAFDALAALVERIINPPPSNVVRMHDRAPGGGA